MGFTEAELGFFLAILLLIVSAMIGKTESAGRMETVPKATFDSVMDSLTIIEERLDSVLKENLRSRAKPSCIEKRLVAAPLLRVTVLAADSVLVDGRRLSMATLQLLHATDLARADSAQCVHVVEVSASSTLAARAYHTAIQRLRRAYYVRFAAAPSGEVR
jgi:hypothetical protein